MTTTTTTDTKAEHLDVLIVGAGLSGIGAACHLQTDAPGSTYALLEARGASGGTWDLFRYPGIRSDSDMFTLGYSFKPWTETKAMAGGADILDYVRRTSAEFGVDDHIRYHRKVTGASWSSAQSRWVVSVQDTESGQTSELTCGFLFLCSGYYSYEKGHTPDWPGLADYRGELVHPQAWPAEFDATGKRVVVIGSGATAVTLVPALADTAASVTMLQRSPSYVLPLPGEDGLSALLLKILPEKRAYAAARWKNVRMSTAIYQFCRKRPERMRGLLLKSAKKRLPEGYDADKHFTPAYEPWDQRMCMAPDGDLFAAIKAGKADVVTDHIESFTATGIRLRSGEELPADVVVTATGLTLAPLGAVPVAVDGEPVVTAEHVAYKGMMLSDVPNLAFAIGYTNASWTLKIDLVCSYVARLVQTMRDHGEAVVTPRLPAEPMTTSPFIEMTSGYFERSRGALPLQGDRAPWRLQQHYLKDSVLYRGSVRSPELEFTPARQPVGV